MGVPSLEDVAFGPPPGPVAADSGTPMPAPPAVAERIGALLLPLTVIAASAAALVIVVGKSFEYPELFVAGGRGRTTLYTVAVVVAVVGAAAVAWSAVSVNVAAPSSYSTADRVSRLMLPLLATAAVAAVAVYSISKSLEYPELFRCKGYRTGLSSVNALAAVVGGLTVAWSVGAG